MIIIRPLLRYNRKTLYRTVRYEPYCKWCGYFKLYLICYNLIKLHGFFSNNLIIRSYWLIIYIGVLILYLSVYLRKSVPRKSSQFYLNFKEKNYEK